MNNKLDAAQNHILEAINELNGSEVENKAQAWKIIEDLRACHGSIDELRYKN
jgi:hypothetical protein